MELKRGKMSSGLSGDARLNRTFYGIETAHGVDEDVRIGES